MWVSANTFNMVSSNENCFNYFLFLHNYIAAITCYITCYILNYTFITALHSPSFIKRNGLTSNTSFNIISLPHNIYWISGILSNIYSLTTYSTYNNFVDFSDCRCKEYDNNVFWKAWSSNHPFRWIVLNTQKPITLATYCKFEVIASHRFSSWKIYHRNGSSRTRYNRIF